MWKGWRILLARLLNMINSTHLYWKIGIIAFIALPTFFGYMTNKDLVKIDTDHCVSLQEAVARYPYSSAEEQFEMDGCEEVLEEEYDDEYYENCENWVDVRTGLSACDVTY